MNRALTFTLLGTAAFVGLCLVNGHLRRQQQAESAAYFAASQAQAAAAVAQYRDRLLALYPAEQVQFVLQDQSPDVRVRIEMGCVRDVANWTGTVTITQFGPRIEFDNLLTRPEKKSFSLKVDPRFFPGMKVGDTAPVRFSGQFEVDSRGCPFTKTIVSRVVAIHDLGSHYGFKLTKAVRS